ncbi:hypothetical protein [Changchengzhania lutea]|uniref:hypothetical protein n=1 Tax=Changchengzhania lutea TaxID=2049305 RepID=UPI001FEBA758|nr:hypothetical protein [Changchengzhania lutea]
MKLNRNIALALVCIFLVKFVTIDANGLSVLFNGSNISFVKPLCKKKNSPKLSKDSINFSNIEISSDQVISLTGFCNSQFHLELFSWKTGTSEPNATYNKHFSSRLSYLYLDNVSPPPRLF